MFVSLLDLLRVEFLGGEAVGNMPERGREMAGDEPPAVDRCLPLEWRRRSCVEVDEVWPLFERGRILRPVPPPATEDAVDPSLGSAVLEVALAWAISGN